MISALSYLGIRSDLSEDWRSFAGSLLGMQMIDSGGKNMAFRMDNQAQRFVVSDEPGETLAFIGWEVENKQDLEDYASRIDAAGHSVSYGSRDLADRRLVEDLIVCHDPAGYRVELAWRPMQTTDPFTPGRPIEGFKTGPFGMGHAVLHVSDPAPLIPFYTDVLGFSVSDYGLSPVPLYFFHVNGRHHSFAIVGSGKGGFHHFMVEYENLDDVGQGYDLAQLKEGRVAYTLGRHTNDYMTSFYAHTPSGFFVESGWGGRVIDPQTWKPHETQVGPSFWGHERMYLDEHEREKFRKMRLEAAANGLRTPHVVNCPWLYGQMPGA